MSIVLNSKPIVVSLESQSSQPLFPLHSTGEPFMGIRCGEGFGNTGIPIPSNPAEQ